MRIEGIRSYVGTNVFTDGPAVALSFETDAHESLDTVGANLLSSARAALVHAGIPVNRIRLLSARRAGTAHIIVETDCEDATRLVLENRVAGPSLPEDQSLKIDDGSTRLAREIEIAARSAGIPAFRIKRTNELQIGYGKNLCRSPLNSSAELQRLYAQIRSREPSSFRIPILSITGTNGKTTVTRWISHILANAGMSVGTTTTEGITIDQKPVKQGDLTGPHSARKVLRDRRVEIAVLETARGGIVRAGLGYDWSDISVLTNIQPDHIGQDGIENIEDLIRIKRIVADRVRPGGTLVLNVDDPQLAALVDANAFNGAPRDVVLYSLFPDQPLFRKHLRAGYRGIALKSDWIVDFLPCEETLIVRTCDIPSSHGGTALFQISNAAAAIAATRAYGLSASNIAGGIRSFRNDQQNSGRNNLFQLDKGFLLVDYGHNPEAIRAIGEMVRAWNIANTTCILGLPGDREDSILRLSGVTAAQYFSRIILREDLDLRGRRSGEVPELVLKAIQEQFPERKTTIVKQERDAIETAAREMTHGDLTVLFFEQWNVVQETLKTYNAQPVAAFAPNGIRVAS